MIQSFRSDLSTGSYPNRTFVGEFSIFGVRFSCRRQGNPQPIPQARIGVAGEEGRTSHVSLREPWTWTVSDRSIRPLAAKKKSGV